MTGTFIRATFNQNQVDSVCILCHQEDETTEHFLLHGHALASHTDPIIDTIYFWCAGVYSPTNSPVSFLQLILDHSALTSITNARENEQLQSIEFHCRRLCHTHHYENLLSLIPRRQRKKKR